MRSLSSIGVFAVLQILLGFSSANALGFEVPTSLYGHENTTLNVPAAFKVDISSDSAHPIDSTAFYLNGIELLYRLSGYNLIHSWGSLSIDLEDYGLEISFESSSPSKLAMTSQHIIWGLSYVAFSMAVTGRYSALTATFKWEGQLIGSMRVNKTARLIQGGGLQLLQNGSMQNVTTSNISTLLPSATWLEVDREDLQISYVYSAQLIDKNDIFLTTMRALGDAIEHGVDNICVSQLTYGIRKCLWVLNSEVGPDGDYLLRYRHAILTILKVIEQMVSDNRFSAVLVSVAVNTVDSGHGGFQIKRPISSAVEW